MDILLKKQMTELNKYHFGEYVNRLTSDIRIIVDGVVTILLQAISMVVKLISGIVVLIYSEKYIINRLKTLQNENYKCKIKRNTVSNLTNTGVYVLFTSGY